MTLTPSEVRDSFVHYVQTDDLSPLFILGDAQSVLSQLPDASIDFCMTSPPYWGKRQYDQDGIGLETTPGEYMDNLLAVFAQVKRVLKLSGSLWLNLGDTYHNKTLLGMPWRVALALVDQQGWILRNSVVWHKVKGGLDNTADRLRNMHEEVFHFVKTSSGYYYDLDAIRSNPRKTKVVNGAVVSATGVTGVRYKRQIELLTALSANEKTLAMQALDEALEHVRCGDLSDFRLIIRGQQRATHSDFESVSGRARELNEKGFYILKYHPKGSKPGDVWDIMPEDTQKRGNHFAPYPEDLCKIPLLATCPPDGLVLDPFCGTGTTMLAARKLWRKSVGIDISEGYLEIAEERCRMLL